MVEMPKSKFVVWAERSASSPWAPFVLFITSFLDLFIFFIPSDAVLGAAIIANPKRYRSFWFAMVTGRAVGALLVFWIFSFSSIDTLAEHARRWHVEFSFEKGRYYFEKYGALSVGITAVSPFPMIFPMALSVVAGASWLQVLGYSVAGTAVRFAVVTALVLFGRQWYQEQKESLSRKP